MNTPVELQPANEVDEDNEYYTDDEDDNNKKSKPGSSVSKRK